MNYKRNLTAAFIVGIILLAGIAYMMRDMGIKDCPDLKIVNRMPGIGSAEFEEYFIKDGERKELSEYDLGWIEVNCKVPSEEVW